MDVENSRVRNVHGDERLGIRNAPAYQRGALRMIDANDFVRDRGAQSLLETEEPVNERSLGKLRGKRLGHRVVNVEDDLATRQPRHESREDEEVGQVVDVNDIQ